MRTYNYSPMLRHSVGFDWMKSLSEVTNRREEVTYPPYNIETDGEDTYWISVAVSAFSDKDLDITLDKGTLYRWKEIICQK